MSRDCLRPIRLTTISTKIIALQVFMAFPLFFSREWFLVVLKFCSMRTSFVAEFVKLFGEFAGSTAKHTNTLSVKKREKQKYYIEYSSQTMKKRINYWILWEDASSGPLYIIHYFTSRNHPSAKMVRRFLNIILPFNFKPSIMQERKAFHSSLFIANCTEMNSCHQFDRKCKIYPLTSMV